MITLLVNWVFEDKKHKAGESPKVSKEMEHYLVREKIAIPEPPDKAKPFSGLDSDK
jgi:hypothetical protein